MKKIFAICLLLLSHQAYAAPQWVLDALKVDNPNQLSVLVAVAPDCPLTEKEATKAVSGVLIRSRVKPLTGNEYWTQPLLLDVQLDCLKSESIYQIFMLTIYFGNASKLPVTFMAHPYNRYGTADKADLISSIKDKVEEAITDFIKANFDL